jgi:hypothetical protein
MENVCVDAPMVRKPGALDVETTSSNHPDGKTLS